MDLEHHTNFRNEIMPGETVAVYVRLVARSPKRIHYLMFLNAIPRLSATPSKAEGAS